MSDYGLTLPHCQENQLKQHQAPASSLFSPSTSQVVTILLEWIAQRPHPRSAHSASRPAVKPLLTARMYRHLMVGAADTSIDGCGGKRVVLLWSWELPLLEHRSWLLKQLWSVSSMRLPIFSLSACNRTHFNTSTFIATYFQFCASVRWY